MNATPASTARPPRTAIAWATRDALFVEIPHASGGPPFIVRERRSIEGLARALNILIEHAEPALRQVPTDHPAIKRTEATARKPASVAWATDEQRAKVRGILRRLNEGK